jgi:hypothetical protein
MPYQPADATRDHFGARRKLPDRAGSRGDLDPVGRRIKQRAEKPGS